MLTTFVVYTVSNRLSADLRQRPGYYYSRGSITETGRGRSEYSLFWSCG